MAICGGKMRYVTGHHLGGGTYGDVFHAYDLMTMKYVAIKVLRQEIVAPEPMVCEAATNDINLWEIDVLNRFHHPNIINLLDAFMDDHKYHLVFELMDTDLCGIIEDQVLSPADIKSYMLMLLQGLAHLHQNSIIHRDVKPDNLLIGPDGVLKLADFGLSCFYNPNVEFSKKRVFARAYRAPELLSGVKWYGPEVDIWAAGCVFAELILGHMLFGSAQDEFEQHQQIYKTFLVPSNSHCTLEYEYCSMETMRKLFPGMSEDCLDLLQQMFDNRPEQRITAQQALNHRYFTSTPMPTPAHLLPRKASHEIDFDYYLKAIQLRHDELESELGISTRGFWSWLHQAASPYVYQAPPLTPYGYQAPPLPYVYQAPAPPSPYVFQAPAPSSPYVHQAPPPPSPYLYQSPAPLRPYLCQAPAPPSLYVYQASAPPSPYLYQSPAPLTPYLCQAPAPPSPYVYQASAPPSPYLYQAPALPLVPCVYQAPVLPSVPHVYQAPALPLVPCVYQAPALPLVSCVYQAPALPLVPCVYQAPALPSIITICFYGKL